LTILARSLAAELLVAGFFVMGYVTATRLVGRRSTLLRWVGSFAASAWIASALFHALSLVHAFRLSCAVPCVGGLALIAVWLGSDRSLGSWWRRELRWLVFVRRALRSSPYRTVVLAVSCLAAIVIAHSLLLPPMGWDSLTYHAVKSATWVQRGGIVDLSAPGTWSLYENLWGGAEVLTAWAMLPFHADTLAMGWQAAVWVALGLALVALARELRGREPHVSAVVALLLATPTIRLQAGTGYVEIVQLLFMVSGLAFAASYWRRPSHGMLVLTAATLGLAAGVKFPGLPMSTLTLAVVLLRAVTVKDGRRVSAIAAALCVFAVGIVPWLWTAYRNSGAPLSPVPVQLFGVELGRTNAETAALLASPMPTTTATAEIRRLTFVVLGGYESPGLPTMVAALLGVRGLLIRSTSRSPAALLAALVVVGSVLEYYSPELSIVRHYWPGSSVRFLILPLGLCAVSSVIVLGRERKFARYYLWFLWIGTFVDFALYLANAVSPRCAAGIVALFAVSGTLLLAVQRLLTWTRSSPLRFAGVVGAVSVFLIAVDAMHARMRPELARMGFMTVPVAPYWYDAAVRVDEPAKTHRIAMTSGPWVMSGNWFAYPFLGSRLQNHAFYVPISRDGVVRHFGSAEVDASYSRDADFFSWLARLRRAGATEIMSFSPASIELAWMEQHPHLFRRVDGDASDWGFFQLQPRSAAAPPD
jgi:hypothetical protein